MVALAVSTSCLRTIRPNVVTRSIRLLVETPERETQALTERRADIEIDTRDFDRTPHVVAIGETPLFSVEQAQVRLFGDDAGTKGFFVDNVIFLEVLETEGRVIRNAIIGFSDPVSQGRETIDNLGRQAFSFEPGELSLNALLPEYGSVRLRATVLDYFGVGRVSDVFVRIEPKPTSGSDDLRTQ
jgi:hypothetical protein